MEYNGYTVESESQEERILARRYRIEERLERLELQENLAAGIIDPITAQTNLNSSRFNNNNPLKNAIEIDNALEVVKQNKNSLKEFMEQGKDLLADVQIATSNNENQRRIEQTKNHKELIERLENEARQEDEKFKEVANKWDVTGKAGKYRNYKDLFNLLTEQNSSCKLIIQQKDKIVKLLKDVVKQNEDSYIKDLKRQGEDIELISKRMENHVAEMKVKFADSVNKIQSTLINDRDQTFKNANEKSENSWKARALRQMEMVYQDLENKINYAEQLDEIRDLGAEQYSIMRNKLEKDVMTHQQQLQQMKAIYLLNQEKLQYNYEILKNREEENSIIKAQQKRKITKLQDNLQNLKVRSAKNRKQQRSKMVSLRDDYWVWGR